MRAARRKLRAGRGPDRRHARIAGRPRATSCRPATSTASRSGPWRLQHVVGEWTFGEHPTYGVVTIAHWVCKDGQPWKVGIGLFLGRGNGKPKDLEIKLAALEAEPPVIDHLILLRPEDDLALTGKSKTLWQDAERRGRHARLEAGESRQLRHAVRLPALAGDADAKRCREGQPLPNLADLLQDKCEKLLEQVCMPVQG